MKAILFAIAAGLFWGVGEVAARSILHSKTIGPLTVLLLRTLIAVPVIALAWTIAMYVAKSPAEPRDWSAHMTTGLWTKLILGSGISAGALAIICFYIAISLGEISRIKPIAFAIAPATAVLLGWLLLGEAMTMRKAGAVVLILAGVVLLTGAPKTLPTELPKMHLD